MSRVVEMLLSDMSEQRRHADELQARIIRKEAELEELRLQRVSAELMAVELRVAASILQDANLRVEVDGTGVRVEVDHPQGAKAAE